MQMLVVPQIVQRLSDWVPPSSDEENAKVYVRVDEPPSKICLTRLKSKNGSRLAKDLPIAVQTTSMFTYSNDRDRSVCLGSYLCISTLRMVSLTLRRHFCFNALGPLKFDYDRKPRNVTSSATLASYDKV